MSIIDINLTEINNFNDNSKNRYEYESSKLTNNIYEWDNFKELNKETNKYKIFFLKCLNEVDEDYIFCFNDKRNDSEDYYTWLKFIALEIKIFYNTYIKHQTFYKFDYKVIDSEEHNIHLLKESLSLKSKELIFLYREFYEFIMYGVSIDFIPFNDVHLVILLTENNNYNGHVFYYKNNYKMIGSLLLNRLIFISIYKSILCKFFSDNFIPDIATVLINYITNIAKDKYDVIMTLPIGNIMTLKLIEMGFKSRSLRVPRPELKNESNRQYEVMFVKVINNIGTMDYEYSSKYFPGGV